MKLKRFVIPEKLEFDVDTASESYTKFFIAPLEKGWGTTIGSAAAGTALLGPGRGRHPGAD
jgi:hypothetical protein